MKMIITKNPFSPYLTDEISGIRIPNQRFIDWQRGYEARRSDEHLIKTPADKQTQSPMPKRTS